jgi:hypothetical protein
MLHDANKNMFFGSHDYLTKVFGWVWDLMRFKIKGKLNVPLRIRAVPGIQGLILVDGPNRTAA